MEKITIDSLSGLGPLAERVGEYLGQNRVVAFYGPMGAGKTTLIKAICSVLAVEDTVTSPTFAIVNQYASAKEGIVNHFDFYRIEDLREALDMGCEEYFYSGDICLIEWPERIEQLLPENTLKIEISPDPHKHERRTFIIG